jgi:transposase
MNKSIFDDTPFGAIMPIPTLSSKTITNYHYHYQSKSHSDYITLKTKVVEFKLTDKIVIATLEQWRQPLRRIWNIGLARLEEYDSTRGRGIPAPHRTYKQQQSAPKCDLPYAYKSYPLDKNGSIVPYYDKKTVVKEWIKVPYSNLLIESHNDILLAREKVQVVVPSVNQNKKGMTKDEWLNYADLTKEKIVVTTADNQRDWGWFHPEASFYSCPLPVDYACPLIKKEVFNQCQIFNSKFDAMMGLSLCIKEEFLSNRHESEALLNVPYAYRSGTIRDLSRAWEQYKKQDGRGKPKYRKYNELPDSISNQNPPKKNVKLDGDTLIGVPHFKRIEIKNISKRWRNNDGTIPVCCVIRFVKKANTWFIQLTGEFQQCRNLKEAKIGAVDPGVYRYLTFDTGKTVNNPYQWRLFEEKIATTQQQIAHKLTHQLFLFLSHPSVTVDNIRSIIRINKENADELLKCKNEEEISKIIGQRTLQQLKHKLTGKFPDILGNGKKILGLQIKVKKLHRQLKNNRRSFAHKLSTWIAKHYEVFVCEDGLQDEGVKHRSNLKMNEDGQALSNKQSAKAGLTKSLSDMALGQFMQLTQDKMVETGRTFIRFDKAGKYATVYSAESPKGKKINFDSKNPTTKACVVCGHINDVPSNHPDSDPLYHCANCGHHQLGRDQKSAVLMLCLLAEFNIIDITQCSDIAQEIYRQRQDYKVTVLRRRKRKSA